MTCVFCGKTSAPADFGRLGVDYWNDDSVITAHIYLLCAILHEHGKACPMESLGVLMKGSFPHSTSPFFIKGSSPSRSVRVHRGAGESITIPEMKERE